jgi:cobalt-zinc-cadmium efflux system protein
MDRTYKGQRHSHLDVRGRKLIISIVLNIVVIVSQVIGGFLYGSIYLLSGALHNFSDVLSLIINYIAIVLSRKNFYQ